MGVNKVKYGNNTVLDISNDTVTADKLLQGYTAHDNTGALIVGTATGGSAVVSQDENGYIVLDDEVGDTPTIASLSVTENGTYTAPSGVAYSPVTVEVEAEPNLLARNVSVAKSEQTITAHSKIVNVNKTADVESQSTGTRLTSMIYPASDYFNVMDKVKLIGSIDIIDSNENVLEEIEVSVDNYVLTESSATAERINVLSSYIDYVKLHIQKQSNVAYISVERIIAGTYGYIIDIDFYGASEYDGLSSVTVGRGYDVTLIKSFIERAMSFTDFEFPEGITVIGDYAFAYCSYLALTSLPNTITSIGSNAFINDTKLALTSLPSSLTLIGNSAFSNCSSLALSSLPSGVTKVDNYAFRGCTALTLSILPSTITYIGQYSFNYCKSITSISCNGVVTTLGNAAFNGDSSRPMQLTSASFPNMALTSNLSTVFGSSTATNACQQLEFCDIGSTTGIAANAFANCYKLQTLVLRKTSDVCVLANVSAFLNTPMRGYNSLTGTVYVPSDLISSYQTATNWSTLYNDGTVTFVAIEGSEYEL